MISAAWAERNIRAVILVLAIIVVGGLYAATQLPIGLFPHVDFPRIRVTLDAGDRPAERMAVEVTYPVEESLRAIPAVRGVRSTTSRGSAEISINFDWGRDMVSAMLEVSAQLSRALPSLPQGTTFEVDRMDPTVFPVIAYSMTSKSRSLVELRDIAMYTLRPAIETVEGVSRIDVQGGDTAEYRVELDLGKLESYGLTAGDVAGALSSANVITAVGRLEDRNKLYLAVSELQLHTAAEIAAVVLRAGPAGVIRVGDVATVGPSTAPNFTRVTADGRDAVLLLVYQQPGGNTVRIAHGVAARIAEQRQTEPWLRDGSVAIANWYDQSRLITDSEQSTRDAILIGIGLAAVVLLVFLRDWRATLIAMLAVPVVIAGTTLLLHVLGMSINLMTLGGIAAAVGLIIDDDIVMIEHIARRLHGGDTSSGDGAAHERRRKRVVDAAKEFLGPLTGSSLSTIIIFLPLAFLTGVTGAFFKALSVTMAAALIISYAVAWLAIPVFSSRLLKVRHVASKPLLLARLYHWVMARLLRFPWIAMLVVGGIGVGGYAALSGLPTGFLPAMDEGGFILDYVAPPGTSLEETDRMLRQVEEIIASNASVATYSRRTGLQLGGGLTEPNTGDFFVELKPFPRPPIDEIMNDIRTKVGHTVPALEIEVLQLMEDLIGDLTAVPQPIEIKLYSDSQEVLNGVAPRVASAIEQISGVVEVKDGIVPAGDSLMINVDPERAALEGLSADTLTSLVEEALSGTLATEILRAPKLVGVRVWIPEDRRRTEEDVRGLMLHAPDGRLFSLGSVATVSTVTGEPEINRDDLRRMTAVTGRIEGRDLGSTIAEVKRVLAKPGLLPAGMGYDLGGLYQQQQIAFRGQLRVLIAGALLVFTLLVVFYNSFRIAGAILLTTLLATAAVLGGLRLTGTELNIASFMGMTMIVGIVTEVGVFYCAEYIGLSNGHTRIERLILAGTGRARAITMTTIAAILALLPLALGWGHGSELLQPMAIAIVAGLVAQLPLVIFVLPCLFAMLRVRHGPGAGARPA